MDNRTEPKIIVDGSELPSRTVVYELKRSFVTASFVMQRECPSFQANSSDPGSGVLQMRAQLKANFPFKQSFEFKMQTRVCSSEERLIHFEYLEVGANESDALMWNFDQNGLWLKNNRDEIVKGWSESYFSDANSLAVLNPLLLEGVIHSTVPAQRREIFTQFVTGHSLYALKLVPINAMDSEHGQEDLHHGVTWSGRYFKIQEPISKSSVSKADFSKASAFECQWNINNKSLHWMGFHIAILGRVILKQQKLENRTQNS